VQHVLVGVVHLRAGRGEPQKQVGRVAERPVVMNSELALEVADLGALEQIVVLQDAVAWLARPGVEEPGRGAARRRPAASRVRRQAERPAKGVPILVDARLNVVAGHGRLLASRQVRPCDRDLAHDVAESTGTTSARSARHQSTSRRNPSSMSTRVLPFCQNRTSPFRSMHIGC